MTRQQHNFDPVARLYRYAEYLTLGPLLQRTRTHFLPQLPPRTQALLLGDGDGRFLAQLLTQQPHLQALAVDTSATMLHLLRRRCQPHANRLQTLQTSALDIFRSPEASAPATISQSDVSGPAIIGYPEALASGLISLKREEGALAPDLITTHFFLDCLTQPQLNTLAQTLAAHTSPGTLWLLSDFGPPHPRFLKPLAALYIRALYLAFRILTDLRVTHLPNPQAALTDAGFDRIARHDLLYGLLYTEIWQRR
jgi:SAM-dependent methyltransferase